MSPGEPDDDGSPTARFHPWLRASLLIRTILETRWDAATWPAAKAALRDVIAERSRLRRAGWFN